jgi:hypothetical protein
VFKSFSSQLLKRLFDSIFATVAHHVPRFSGYVSYH